MTLTAESVFADACNVVAPDGQRYSLVSSAIGDGPLNVVLNRSEPFSVIEIGDPVICDSRGLLVGRGWRIDLSMAKSWDPMPRYNRLAAWPYVVRNNIAWMSGAVAPQSPLVESPGQDTVLTGAFGSRPSGAVMQGRAREAIHALLTAHRRGDIYRIKTAARRLAGLGPGLTPAGDDWMAGWLVGLRIGHIIDDANHQKRIPIATVGKAVLQGASHQTTELSLAFLAAAADGALPRAWHLLIDALSSADRVPLHNATGQILSIGATSGSDMLAGFLAAFEPAN
ncbi:MAG: DUF2877 domain-containing protein [Caldilineales bacterium]